MHTTNTVFENVSGRQFIPMKQIPREKKREKYEWGEYKLKKFKHIN